MTENEIKEYIEELRHKANTLIKSGYATSGISTHFNKSADLIEELLEYKLNGSFSGVELAQLAAMQMRLRDYQAIGTIEEFKALKEKNEQIPIIHGKAELELHDKGIRNKVIDEFAEKFIFKAVCEGCSGCCNCHEEGRQSECEDWKAYMEIAEEMRGAE